MLVKGDCLLRLAVRARSSARGGRCPKNPNEDAPLGGSVKGEGSDVPRADRLNLDGSPDLTPFLWRQVLRCGARVDPAQSGKARKVRVGRVKDVAALDGESG